MFKFDSLNTDLNTKILLLSHLRKATDLPTYNSILMHIAQLQGYCDLHPMSNASSLFPPEFLYPQYFHFARLMII